MRFYQKDIPKNNVESLKYETLNIKTIYIK